MPELVTRLLLDAEAELVRAADAIPALARTSTSQGLNPPAWILAHVAFFLDVWLSADAQGKDMSACDDWLAEWFMSQQASPNALVVPSFEDARAALGSAIERTTPFVTGLIEADLESIPENLDENGWPRDITVGYFIAREAAHLFAHAAELNHVAVVNGAPDIGLPGALTQTRDWGRLRPRGRG